MIVSCEKEKLNSLVQTALRAVSTRVTMPILSGVLVGAEEGRLTFCGTDLEMSVRAESEATIKESGSTVVSGRILGDIMKNLPGGEVTLETGEKYLTVKAESGEYRIREMMPEDFPQMPQWEGGSVLRVGAADFSTAVQQASRASSSDEKRPILTGMLIEKQGGGGTVRMVSTDSYRLAWREVDVSGEVAAWEDCIVPTKSMNEIARLAGSAESDVEMKIREKQSVFKVDDIVISSRLIEGQFPNYKQLVPKGEKTGVRVKKEELLSVLKRALIFGHNLRLGVYSDRIRVTTETPEVGESKEDLPAEVSGEEMEIGFNGTYLLDGVTGVDAEKVEIKMDDPQKPALIKADGSESYVYIIMPVRLR